MFLVRYTLRHRALYCRHNDNVLVYLAPPSTAGTRYIRASAVMLVNTRKCDLTNNISSDLDPKA